MSTSQSRFSRGSDRSFPFDEPEDELRSGFLQARGSTTRRRPRGGNSDIHAFGHGDSVGVRRRNQLRMTSRRNKLPPDAQSYPSLSPDSSWDLPPPPPSLGTIASTVGNAISLYFIHVRRSLRKPCRKCWRYTKISLLSLIGFVLVLLLWLIYCFYVDAVRICAPIPGETDWDSSSRPLVEYYVHGRGNGHSARSVAIVEKLNDAGVDVRMFIGRATMWRAFYEDTTKTFVSRKKRKGRGSTTAIAVTSVVPGIRLSFAISHTLERIMGDCEVAYQHSKYPMLVITDGDMPGMIRAKLGGIPSVGISHGQVFRIAQPPDWLDRSKHAIWRRQGRVNWFATICSSWQIATNFLHMESTMSSGVVARPPLRPELMQMRRARKSIEKPAILRESNILFGDETHFNSTTRRRRVVLCYFRDGNGQAVAHALMAQGFDVLLVDGGHMDGNEFGRKYIVHPSNDTDTNTTLRRLRRDSHVNIHPRRRLSINDGLSPPRLKRVVDRPLFVPLLSVVDGVASSAGSQLLSECLYLDVPLLALYKEQDGEQMLNVEMTRHCDPKTSHVYGDSFESLIQTTGDNNLRREFNGTVYNSLKRRETNSHALEQFQSFVDIVRQSNVSQLYFDSLTSNSKEAEQAKEEDSIHEQDKKDDPFHGMPDAAAIILEIIKKVQSDLS